MREPLKANALEELVNKSKPGTIALLLVVLLFAAAGGPYLWDFRLYYNAGLAANLGLNPYEPAQVAQFIPLAEIFPVSYPWITLLPYRFLALFPLPIAIALFSIAKILAIAAIVQAWRKLFPAAASSALFPFIMLVAFNKSLMLDLASGNVALFETCLLTLAFAAYAGRRFTLFALLVAGAALIKIAPLFFLSLLLFTGERRRLALIPAAGALFFAILLMPLLFAPEYVTGFIRNATAVVDERGAICPSTLPALRDLFRLLAVAAPSAELVFLAIAAAITAAATFAARARASDPIRLILIAVFTYALIHPRFKDYAYVLLVGPACHLSFSARGWKRWLPLLVIVLPMRPAAYTGATSFLDWCREYYPWFVVIALWSISLLKKPFEPVSSTA